MDKCNGAHCSQVSDFINKQCKQNGWQVNHLATVCDFNTGECCTCTCSCMAYNTPVAITRNSTKAIQSFAVGDEVMTRTNGQWVSQKVAFSNGTDSNSVQPEMCYITYILDGEEKTIIVTLDHTFLNQDGKLIQARQLAKGYTLALANGDSIEIENYKVDVYTGGVWNISTSVGDPKSLEGHLLNTQGLISGDYAVQLYYDEFVDKGLAVAADERPHFNSKSYLSTTAKSILKTLKVNAVDLSDFISNVRSSIHFGTHHEDKTGSLLFNLEHGKTISVSKNSHTDIRSFFTDTEGNCIETHDTIVDKNVLTLSKWVLTIIQSFYPDIDIVVDYQSQSAHAYSILRKKKKHIFIDGGLLRAKEISWQGVALIVSHLVAYFHTESNKKLLSEADANYAATGVLQNVFYPLYPNVVFDALEQLTYLFDSIKDRVDPSVKDSETERLDCRIATYKSAMAFMPMPDCSAKLTDQ